MIGYRQPPSPAMGEDERLSFCVIPIGVTSGAKRRKRYQPAVARTA
ncbi:hypothetical protein Atep_14010 [Allochromatium tepidum]|uniref:Uncharacterized protein n=1 Tax=Allochromatium tepidum TaxID=553982 RepID=A0ABM7QLK3_9GAMM|nr:hypothetical protein Atep_14010 [Allochromatium tepidum]